MGPLLLALSLGAAPDLWVATQGFDQPACDSSSLVAALRAQRPSGPVHVWHPGLISEQPPASAVFVRLASRDGSAVLEISGAGAPITRTLPPVDDCKRDVDLAALIVDGALDDLRVAGSAPRVDSLAPPVPFRSLVQAGIAFGAGVEQGPAEWIASLDLEGVARYRFYEVTLDFDFGVPSSIPFVIGPPEGSATRTTGGTIPISSLAVESGLGIAPRLGPGRVSIHALLGVTLTFLSAPTPSASAVLFDNASRTVAEAFTGLRLGYAVDLPFGFFASARAEERFTPLQTAFGVVDSDPSTFSVSTRTWTFQGLGFLGYRFL